MGSAKETEALQLLNREAVPEDADKPTISSPCGCRKNSCLQNVSCASGDFTMRNCCVNELGTKDSSQKVAMVDNPNQKEKAQAVDPKSSVDLVAAAAAELPLLKNTGVGGTPPEAKGEAAACHEWKQNSKQDERMEEISNSTVTICSSLGGKVSPVAGEACRHLPTEPCLKGPNKDSSSTPTSLKHVAFFEPTTGKAKEECSQIKTVPSKMGSTLPACLQNTSQGQPLASKGDKSHISSEAMEYGKEDSRSLFGSDGMKESILEPSKAETTSERSAMPVAAKNPLSDTEETRFPVAETHPPGSSNKVPDVLVTSISYEVKHQGTSGELESSPAESMEEKTGRTEPTISSCKSQDQAHGKKVEMISRATSEEHATNEEMTSVGHLAQTCILEVTPPQHDAGTQIDNRVSLVSVAISPINPPDGSSAFPFHTRGLGTSLKSPGPEEKPTKRDVEMQVSIPVETRSVATGPMTPVTKSPQSSYPEVHIKSAEEETSEPIREVSWDEKGMTWEVYGASMEVEVLGMAIQKHLEKQIEEHGRQMVMTPQSTRSSSVKAATRKGEIKRQPSVFRALLQNVRRPRCCSRGGPAVE